MIDMTPWPEDSQEIAKNILSTELKRLLMKLDIYMLLVPHDSDNRVTYTVELSDIFHDVGRCEIIAEVAGNIYVYNMVCNVAGFLTDLLNHINYDDTRDKLMGMIRTLREIIHSLNIIRIPSTLSMEEL